MTEVQLLQVIGLTVVGVGAALLLFVKARFIRVVAFVSMVLGAFSLVALGVPQKLRPMVLPVLTALWGRDEA